MKKVFLDNLLKHKEKINWELSVGKKVNFIYDDIKGEVEIVGYSKETRYLSIKYLDKDIFKINTSGFRQCQLGILLETYTGSFKIKIKTNFKDDKRNLTIIDRKYRKDNNGKNYKLYKYKCNTCGWDKGWVKENDLLKGNGCACCKGFTVVEGINNIPKTAPWMVKFFQGGYNEAKLYTKSSGKKIYPICPDCGRIKNTLMSIWSIYSRHSIGCTCGDGYSYPNKFMFSLLEKLYLDFETEYSPDWITPKKFDFYFISHNKKYIIEMDGGWHKQNNNLSGQTKEESQEIDNYKDKIATANNIKVIRINCDISELEYIKNSIVNSEISDIFDLSDIDWNKCEEFALSNIVKEICDLKRKNPNLSTTEIKNIMGIGINTIIRYLKKGTNLGWCNYSPTEEIKKSKLRISLINKDRMCKKVICLETNVIYDGITIACKETNTRQSGISQCCIGNYKTSGGYHWMYYEEYLKLNKDKFYGEPT